MTLCRHCCRRNVCRPRGLCWRCDATPGVRDLYPTSGHRGAMRGVPNFNGPAAAPEPTAAAPSTPAKVAVMAARAAAGQELFSRFDAGWEAVAALRPYREAV